MVPTNVFCPKTSANTKTIFFPSNYSFRLRLRSYCTGMGTGLPKMIQIKRFLRFAFLVTLAYTVLWFAFYKGSTFELSETVAEDDDIILIHASCGQRKLKETLTMLKSAILFQNSSKLHFILFTDTLQDELKKSLDNWKRLTNQPFSYEFQPIRYPGVNENNWINLFGKCATQRLFFPSLLPDVKKVLYVDADILFMNDLSEIWRLFRDMNSTQMLAASEEMQDKNNNLYKGKRKIPFYGDAGLNSGVLLMDLEKMLHFNWENKSIEIFTKYKSRLIYHDQDIINIIFNFHPEGMYPLSCSYNLKKYECWGANYMCRDAVRNGISILHGQNYVFTTSKITENNQFYSFKLIYQAYENYQLGTDPVENLWKPLRRELKKLKNNDCTAFINVYLERTKGISTIP